MARLRNVCAWACLAWWPSQLAGNVAWGILHDVPVPSQLGAELSELCISLGKSPLERLQQDERCCGPIPQALMIWREQPATIITNCPSSAARWRTVS